MLTELQFYCLKFVKLKDVLSSFLILGLLLCRHFSFPTWKQCSKFGELGRLLVFADHGHRSLHQVFALKHRHVPMSLKTKSHHYTKGLPNNALPGFTALFSRCLKILGKVVFSIARWTKNSLKMPKWWKISKFKNWNATFWVIFKQCVFVYLSIKGPKTGQGSWAWGEM